jgi:hypothetical protein
MPSRHPRMGKCGNKAPRKICLKLPRESTSAVKFITTISVAAPVSKSSLKLSKHYQLVKAGLLRLLLSLHSGHRSIAECARIAFSCLRTLQASKISGIDFPDLQLENGMSVLIGKLVSLGLDDLAIKELRVLKRRLDSAEGSKRSSASKGAVTANAQTLSDMLDFGKAQFTGAKLGLVITTQLQILRLIDLFPEAKTC